MPSSPSGSASRVASVMHWETAPIAPSKPTAARPWMAEMQNASLPRMCTTPAPLSTTRCICGVMSGEPSGTAVTSKSSPAPAIVSPSSASMTSWAWGTSMITKATLSAPSASARAIGRPKNAAAGLTMRNVDRSSSSRPPPDAERTTKGMPASWSGSQAASVWAPCGTVTATTPASIIWCAQSAAVAGSTFISHVTSSMGRPPIPPRWALRKSAAAWPAGISSPASTVAEVPSVSCPIRTGSPLAGSSAPSRSAASPSATVSSVSRSGSADEPSPPQAPNPTTSTPMAVAHMRDDLMSPLPLVPRRSRTAAVGCAGRPGAAAAAPWPPPAGWSRFWKTTRTRMVPSTCPKHCNHLWAAKLFWNPSLSRICGESSWDSTLRCPKFAFYSAQRCLT